MNKVRKIKTSNFAFYIGITDVVVFWFLWDKFQQEWVRTLLIIWFSFKILVFVIQMALVEWVDLLPHTKEGGDK